LKQLRTPQTFNLAAAFGRDRVLYDKFHEAEFTRVGLDVDLPNLYRTQSELIALFLYPHLLWATLRGHRHSANGAGAGR
jgi:hypothetical protein